MNTAWLIPLVPLLVITVFALGRCSARATWRSIDEARREMAAFEAVAARWRQQAAPLVADWPTVLPTGDGVRDLTTRAVTQVPIGVEPDPVARGVRSGGAAVPSPLAAWSGEQQPPARYRGRRRVAGSSWRTRWASWWRSTAPARTHAAVAAAMAGAVTPLSDRYAGVAVVRVAPLVRLRLDPGRGPVEPIPVVELFGQPIPAGVA